MWVLASVAWVAIVIAGSAVTWLAIDRAGQQVTGNPDASETQPAVVGTIGSAPTAAAKPSHRPTPSASVSGTPAVTARPTVVVPAPTRAATPRSSSPAPRTPSPPAPSIETRTWTGAPGWVTVACTGSRATFKGASPNDGWSFERGDTSGEEIEVKFGNGATEVQVRATCVAGVPRFQVDSGSDDG
jgi:hypothetical protein